MRTCYIVMYDISDPKRLQKVFKKMRGFGDHIQLSVFRCALSDREKLKMVSVLKSHINHREDQVIIIDLGMVSEQMKSRFECIGRPFSQESKPAHVI